MRLAVAVAALAACHRAPAPTLPPAGDERDDGDGDLARASVQLVLGSSEPAGFDDDSARRRHRASADDDDGDGIGDGVGYAGWTPPTFTAAPHAPRYAVTASGLDGELDGVVTWVGDVPRALAPAACGTGMRVGPDRAVQGALVYIEHVAAGRAFASYATTATVGGIVVKRDCALAPDVQVVAPVPAVVAIHGDAAAARVRVTRADGSAPASLELGAGGTALLDVRAGVTELTGADGALGPAWIVGVATPYVAVTDDAGRFRIDQLPPATYDVTIFAAPSRLGGAPIVAHRTVRVGGEAPTRLPVALGR